MPNTYHQVYLQVVFAVKYREAAINKTWRPTLLGVIGNLINETGCKTIIVNGVEDHIHCLLGLKPVVSISELMKTVKAKSSKYINDHKLTRVRFEWQEGYGVFSYSQSQIESVYQYIVNQEEHHKEQTFREEYLEFLEKFKLCGRNKFRPYKMTRAYGSLKFRNSESYYGLGQTKVNSCKIIRVYNSWKCRRHGSCCSPGFQSRV